MGGHVLIGTQPIPAKDAEIAWRTRHVALDFARPVAARFEGGRT